MRPQKASRKRDNGPPARGSVARTRGCMRGQTPAPRAHGCIKQASREDAQARRRERQRLLRTTRETEKVEGTAARAKEGADVRAEGQTAA